jgi:hypothetical protein
MIETRLSKYRWEMDIFQRRSIRLMLFADGDSAP